MRTLVARAAFVLLLAGLVGCSADEAAAPRSSGQSPATAAATPDRAAHEEAVRDAFATYRTAALEKDGAAAVRVVASTAHPFYDQARRDALVTPEDQVKGKTLAERFTIYVMRGSLTADVLRTATPPELVAAAVDAGLVGEQGIQSTDIGEVEVTGDRASAQALSDGDDAGIRFSFVREQAAWKIDLLPLLQLADTAFPALAERQGVTAEDYVDQLLQTLYGPEGARRVRLPLGD